VEDLRRDMTIEAAKREVQPRKWNGEERQGLAEWTITTKKRR